MERFRFLFSITVFPLTMCAAVGATILLIERGVEPAVAFVGPTVFSYLFVWSCERLLPYDGDWNRSRGDMRVDLGHLLVSGALTLELLRPLMLAIGVYAGGLLSGASGVRIWPGEANLVGQLVLALVIGEFSMYWAHRFGHTTKLLWRFHAVHHSAPRLYFLNAVRFHPVDMALATYAPFVSLVILGADERVLALFALVSGVHGVFQHANIPLRLGPLNYFFSMAELHRWHHSRRIEESNTNYGQNLIVWDIVFGTRFLPKDRLPPSDIGLVDLPAFPMDYWGQLLSPFTFKRIEQESEGAR